MATSIVSNSTAATFGNSPQKTGEPVDRLNIYSGKALEFDGVGDYLDAGSNQTYALTNNGFTLSMWIYPEDITTTQTYLTQSGSTHRIYFNSNAGQMGVKIDDKGGTTPTFTPTFTAGQWYKLDLVYKAGIIYIYNNGVAVSFSSPAEDFWDQTGDGLATEYIHRYIGFYGVGGKLNSKISNYQIWNIAWEASDVQYAYKNPEKLITDNPSVTSGITTSNLKLWYPMNDTGVRNPQTVVFDAAGTNNTTKNHATTTFLGDDKLSGGGAFDASTNWTVVSGSVGTEWTINDSSNSKAVHNTGTTKALRYTGSSGDLVNGTTYQVDFTIADRTAGSLTFAIGGSAASSSQTASGSIELTAGGTSNRIIDINPTSDFDGSIDSVTVKEIGIASGWTEANQQQTIPQTSLMDGCVKSFAGEGVYSNTVPSLSYPFSLSCWIYKGDDVAYAVYLTDKDVGNVYFGIALGADDKVYLQASNTTNKNTNSNSTYTNQWVHVVASFESATDRNLYINGAQNTDNENNDSVTYENIDRISIGYLGDSSPIYSGAETIVDEVCVFNTGLDIAEVQELYNNGLPLNATKHSLGTSNLVGYWKNNNLNSEGKWKDQISTNHGTINGTPDYIFFQQGVTANLCTQGYSNNIVHSSGGSLHLNGSTWAGSYEGDYGELPQDIHIDGDFSVEMWRKLTREFDSDDDGFILGANNTDFISIPNGVLSSGQLNKVYIRTLSGDNKTITMDSSTDGVDLRPSVYEWFHVILVRESATYKVYVNGVDLNTGDRDVGDSANKFTFRKIALMVGTGNQAQGFIDDLRIYDKALSSSEALKNYNVGKSKHKNN